jgi:phage/plasmid-associated DNA primase
MCSLTKTLLYAFNNKVYDLENGVLSIQDTTIIYPTPADTITHNYTRRTGCRTKKLINSIFLQKNTGYLYVFYRRVCAVFKNVFIGTGVGGNGKSLLNDLAMKTFGEYGYKLNSSVLMHEPKGGLIQNSLI